MGLLGRLELDIGSSINKGKFENVIECSNCAFRKGTEEEFAFISLPTGRNYLQDSLDEYFLPQPLEARYDIQRFLFHFG
jgi:hypothetical protein